MHKCSLPANVRVVPELLLEEQQVGPSYNYLFPSPHLLPPLFLPLLLLPLLPLHPSNKILLLLFLINDPFVL